MKKSTKLDSITFEVLRHRLWAINDEMAMVAGRMSGSPVVYETGDFNAGLLSADGKGLFSGVYVIRMAAALDMVVEKVIEAFGDDMADGDAFMVSDPWYGALHAMDAAVVRPVFFEGEVIAWTGIVFHELDMGGSRPGSFAIGAKNAYEECALIPPIKIVEQGRIRADMEAWYLRQVRTPDLNGLNLRAKIAAQEQTAKRLCEIAEEIGKDNFLAFQEEILDYVKGTVRQRLSELPDGTWYSQTFIDHDGNNDQIYRMRLAMTKRGDRLTFDFTGTDAQALGPVNCTYSGLVAGILEVLLPMICFDVPWSHGAVRECIDIISEPGTINNALFPAATSLATVSASQSTSDLVWQTMSSMYACSPTTYAESIALGHGSVNLAIFSGKSEEGKSYLNYFTDPIGGGGARSFSDGINTGGNPIAPAYAIPNVERIESLAPVLYVYRRERAETAGAGAYRGGVALEVMAAPHGAEGDTEAVFFSGGCVHPSTKGVSGGMPGSIQRNVLFRNADVVARMSQGLVVEDFGSIPGEGPEVVPAKAVLRLQPGDAWANFCSGGGGFGDPLSRDPLAVLNDVMQGSVTAEEAHRNYAVVIDGDEVDETGTAASRQSQRRSRLEQGVRLGEDWSDGPFSGENVFQVGQTLAVRKSDAGAVLGCTNCDRAFGPAAEDPRSRSLLIEKELEELSPLNHFALRNEIVVRMYCCPGCGTCFSTDVARREDDPSFPMMHLIL